MSRIVLLLVTGSILAACQATTAPALRTTTMSAETLSVPKTHLIVPRY